MKETGHSHWLMFNDEATNESDFKALPGGYRSDNGNFYALRYNAYFWVSSPDDMATASYRALYYYDGNVHCYSHFTKTYGLSARCVKD